MTGNCCTTAIVYISILLAGVTFSYTPANAQPHVLDLRVMDTTAESGSKAIPLSVYMNNYEDTVAGYSFWLVLDRPDLVSFELTFDTSGTLSSGWELIQVNHVGGQPYNIKVVAVANWPAPPTTPGIPPQQNGFPLIKFLLNAEDIPDTTTDRTVNIMVSYSNLSEFAFSDPGGKVIGTVSDSVLDTTYYSCTLWENDTTCLEWTEVLPGSPYDSMGTHWHVYEILDTTRVGIDNGSITITGGYVCGNIDGDPSGSIDISDLVYLATYMFTGGDEPPALMSADCNGDGAVDISDIVYLVDYMFLDGPPPICGK